MNRTDKMQEIKKGIMDSQGCTNDQAVRYIAELLSRSPSTVYEYMSNNRPDIPKQSLELLEIKLGV